MFKRFLIWLGWITVKSFFLSFFVSFILLIVFVYAANDLFATFWGIVYFFMVIVIFFYSSKQNNWRIAIDYAKKNFKENNRILDLIPETRKTRDSTEINKLMDLLEELETKEKELQELTDGLAPTYARIDKLKKEVAELEERLPK